MKYSEDRHTFEVYYEQTNTNRKKLATSDCLEESYLEIGMTHHDTVVSFKVRLWETLSQGVCHHEICVQSHQLNQINQTQFVDVVSTIIPDKIFHLRYRDIVGSLGYLVNMVCTIPTTRSHCFGSTRPPISSRHLCTGHQVPL